MVHDYQIAESGLKPPFESPHLDYSDENIGAFFVRKFVAQTLTTHEPATEQKTPQTPK